MYQCLCLRYLKSSFNRINHLDIEWYPYVIQRRNRLEGGDYQRRLDYSQRLTTRHDRFLRDIIIGDEAIFPMDGNVNSHNVLCYSPRNQPPRDLTYDRPHDKQKLVIWAGMLGNGSLLGPILVDGNINAEKHLDVINNQIVPRLLEIGRFNLNQNGSIQVPGFSRTTPHVTGRGSSMIYWSSCSQGE